MNQKDWKIFYTLKDGERYFKPINSGYHTNFIDSSYRITYRNVLHFPDIIETLFISLQFLQSKVSLYD